MLQMFWPNFQDGCWWFGGIRQELSGYSCNNSLVCHESCHFIATGYPPQMANHNNQITSQKHVKKLMANYSTPVKIVNLCKSFRICKHFFFTTPAFFGAKVSVFGGDWKLRPIWTKPLRRWVVKHQRNRRPDTLDIQPYRDWENMYSENTRGIAQIKYPLETDETV